MGRVPLHDKNGKLKQVALVDDADEAALLRWRWHLDNHGYATRHGGPGKVVQMHRQVMGVEHRRQVVRRRNDNRIDNRRDNLFVVDYRPRGLASAAEWAWAAGLFEGEGSISGSIPKGKKTHYSVIMSLSSTDQDVIERFTEIVGVGTARGPYFDERKPHYKPSWTWSVRAWTAIHHVLIRFAPHLCERRFAAAVDASQHRPIDSWLPGYTKRLQPFCKRGHALDGENRTTSGSCRICTRERRQAWLQTPAGKAYLAKRK